MIQEKWSSSIICQSPSSRNLPYVSADLDPVLVGLKGLEMDLFAIKMLDESIALLPGFITRGLPPGCRRTANGVTCISEIRATVQVSCSVMMTRGKYWKYLIKKIAVHHNILSFYPPSHWYWTGDQLCTEIMTFFGIFMLIRVIPFSLIWIFPYPATPS